MEKLPLDKGIKFVEITQAQVNAMRSERESREKSFFAWWKKGVELAGHEYFGDGTYEGFVAAENKNQLRPIRSNIESSIGVASDSQIAFLTGLYCFFNDYVGAELCNKANVRSLGNFMTLDEERREVIAALILTYNGW